MDSSEILSPATSAVSNQEEVESDAPSCSSGDSTGEKFVPVLLCTYCRMPIAQYGEILSHRATDAWASQVYTYELELFDDNPPLWCYSATNPSAHRFDLVRCDAAIALGHRRIQLTGAWSAEHTFFLGHEWRYAVCKNCNSFLGWGFRPSLQPSNDVEDAAAAPAADAEATDEGLSFVGIILTRCTGHEKYPLDLLKFREVARSSDGPS
ncbi:hypothetical protein TraAM80_02226 [Trypanosoma rangeli]|uniref:CULT domain-containing protein n=1 Tax=Trypanosoma rangeli TaxID=5698 RepID=A0A3R7KKL7_TRYRA|nr:uncharacterized protein TraAM80_02226 [Trypanosoma rangeli]RNF09352.1 hypothetical protein TraAM80_02226 [Trypanosoma rangeli]|eukprot:RNF09352.1 hypothetical protein TraAM80_02226 [Trypanosoma rangeli]